MERIWIVLSVFVLLAGCAGPQVPMNYQDRKAEVAKEWAKPIPCTGMSSETCIAVNMGKMIAAASMNLNIEKPMDDNEAVVAVTGNITAHILETFAGMAIYRAAKQPSSVEFNGDGNAYTASDVAGASNSTAVPVFSPPTTTTTTTMPQ